MYNYSTRNISIGPLPFTMIICLAIYGCIVPLSALGSENSVRITNGSVDTTELLNTRVQESNLEPIEALPSHSPDNINLKSSRQEVDNNSPQDRQKGTPERLGNIETANNKSEEIEMDPFTINIRSTFDTTSSQRQLINFEDDSPVRVQMNSTSIKERPSWFKKDHTVSTEPLATKINLSSPLSILPAGPNQ